MNNELESLLKFGTRKFYKEKATIYEKNQSGEEGFYYLKTGLIKISTTYSGEEKIIDIVSAKNTFGEQTIDGTLYFTTATALKDSIVYFFSYKQLEEQTISNESFRLLISQLISKSLSNKLRTLSDNVLLSTLPSEKILARTILDLKSKFVNETIPFSQQELSRYTNLNRITLYNIFKKWDEDIVSIRNKQIIINNENALKEIAFY